MAQVGTQLVELGNIRHRVFDGPSTITGLLQLFVLLLITKPAEEPLFRGKPMGRLVIRPAFHPRAGWEAQCRLMAERGDDELLDPEAEWEW